MEGIAGIVQGVEALQIGDLSILQDHAFKSAAVSHNDQIYISV